MTREEAEEAPLGLYLIFWESGGMSKALITQNESGTRIIKCHNWTANSYCAPFADYVEDIEKIVFVM